MPEHRIYSTPFASVYPHFVAKVEKKGRSVAELLEVIKWLTGYDKAGLAEVLEDRRSFRDFFDKAPNYTQNARLITGTVCGIRVENIEDPLMQKIRYLDKLVDELAKGKKMEKILRMEGTN